MGTVRIGVVVVAVCGLLAGSLTGQAQASHFWYFGGQVAHRLNVELNPPLRAEYGDSLGWDTGNAAAWRSAFRGAVTNSNSQTWGWASTLQTSTVFGLDHECIFATSRFSWRANTPNVCVGDYRSDLGNNILGRTTIWYCGEIGQRCDQAHILTSRVLINEPPHFGDIAREGRTTICHEVGHTLGLYHTSPDPDSCMNNSYPSTSWYPNYHDHMAVDDIYRYHGG